MTSFVRGCIVGCLLLAGGCDRAAPATVPLPQLEQPGGGMEWRGLLPCVDCDGIRTRLLLRRSDDGGQYRLVEAYLVGDSGVRFVENGRWRRDGDLIRIESDGGGRRTFSLRADRSLQPSDAHGRVNARRTRVLLLPVPPHDVR